MDRFIERIASFADIDTRRALGIYGKLPKSEFVPRPISPTTFRYFAKLKKILYINFDVAYDTYMWEVYEDVEPEGDAWLQGRYGKHRGVWRGIDDFVYFDARAPRCPIYFAGFPDIVA